MPSPVLLLISRDDILAYDDSPSVQELYRLLGRLTRLGFRLLSTAPQPEDWYSSSDDALLGPHSIRKQLAEAGGTLDGVYFIPRSSFTQRRNREEALQDILDRYKVKAENCFLFSSSRKFVRAASGMGIHATSLHSDLRLLDSLKSLLLQHEERTGETRQG
jgi:hypothetical protein